MKISTLFFQSKTWKVFSAIEELVIFLWSHNVYFYPWGPGCSVDHSLATLGLGGPGAGSLGLRREGATCPWSCVLHTTDQQINPGCEMYHQPPPLWTLSFHTSCIMHFRDSKQDNFTLTSCHALEVTSVIRSNTIIYLSWRESAWIGVSGGKGQPLTAS